MKPAIILLHDGRSGRQSAWQAREAVTALRHGLRTVPQCSPRASTSLETGRDDVDVVVIDLDPGIHGTALLEASGSQFPGHRADQPGGKLT